MELIFLPLSLLLTFSSVGSDKGTDGTDLASSSPTHNPASSRTLHGHQLPMTPHNAIREFGKRLSVFEHKEITEYPEVWFLGLDSKKVAGDNTAALNNGTVLLDGVTWSHSQYCTYCRYCRDNYIFSRKKFQRILQGY